MLRDIGVNHVGLNLKHGTPPPDQVVKELGEYVVPDFTAKEGKPPQMGAGRHLAAPRDLSSRDVRPAA